MSLSSPDNFFSEEFLTSHIKSIFKFYDDIVVDAEGGYFQNFKDDGTVFNPKFKQLVSSTRIIVNYAHGSTLFANEVCSEQYKQIALHGLEFLEQVHWREDRQYYAWTLEGDIPLDMTQQAYGYAFVLLAYAAIHKNNIRDTLADMDKTYERLESRFWQSEYGLYADEISPDGILETYRGQNANMHLCEAMIAAYEASHDEKYLQRASEIAENISGRQAGLTDGLVWEHYQQNFQPDWDYNRDDPKNLYRPWGFQPGHQTEWTKLLLSLYRYNKDQSLLNRAKDLFDRAYDTAWDEQHGGLIYGFDPEGKWCDDDKYFWVQAESFAAAAMLYQVTGESRYLDCYQSLWRYSWKHMVDHQYGAWFRVLKRDNSKYSDEKSSAGAKCDYHTLGACYEVLRVLR